MRQWNRNCFEDLNAKIAEDKKALLDIQNEFETHNFSNDLFNSEMTAHSKLSSHFDSKIES